MIFANCDFSTHQEPAGVAYSSDAAQLRLTPGQWPKSFVIQDVDAVFCLHQKREDAQGETAAMEYVAEGNGSLRATIWND